MVHEVSCGFAASIYEAVMMWSSAILVRLLLASFDSRETGDKKSCC